MAAYINTNVSALNAQRNLSTSQTALQTSLQRLSSGLRINSAKDDAAGLAISSRMTSQINGNMQAARNANDGISLAQTAEGDLAQIGTNLQRMRDLAVQSSNATNSASDRAALNAEVQSLAAEIDRVSQNSSFNGVKLLDGSFTAQNFQVGAGATSNDSIAIGQISSARTSQLGAGIASTSTTLSGTAVTGALTAGDLTLNGFQVGASVAGVSPGQSAASAFQIAAAINGVSANTGVAATANAATVTGGPATAFTAIAASTFSINGVSVGAVTAGGTAPGQGANLAAAINLVATQTGVTASADATTGALTMTAADGRDINIAMSGTAVSAAAAAAAKTTLLAQTGLATGVVGTRGAAATPTTTVASGAISGSVVSGITTTAAVGTFTVDGLTLFTNTIAAGATGTLITAANLDTAFTAFNTANPGYTLTGTFAAGTAQVTKADGSAITLATSLTGGAGGAISAFAAAGAGFMGTTAAAGVAFAGVAVANRGTVTLNSTSAAGIVLGGGTAALAGFTVGTTAATTVSNAISATNVSTSSGALAALATIDSAIATVNSSRASLGAFQNRFASVVVSLQTTSENLTASRSRIMDTDFAAETSNLTKNQILQQAGTAMLAQANQLPQGVLALLRG